MIQEGSLVKVLRIFNDMYGKPINAEYVYGRVASINELYQPPILVEIILPNKSGESSNFYRFWTDKENVTFIANPVVIQDSVNPFGY